MKIFNRAKRYTLFALYGSANIASFLDTVVQTLQFYENCFTAQTDNFEPL